MQDRGSLTERLRQYCQHFRVQLLNTAQVKLTADQAAWLGVERAYCREVLLLCDEQPWVYANSLYSPAALSAVPALGGLGDSALGELLFEHPLLTRSEFEFARLTVGQCQQLNQRLTSGAQPTAELHVLLSQLLAGNVTGLPWARRSVLATPEAAVLVSELFLPSANPNHALYTSLNKE
ncbi:chorismate lyase [Oceanisphaera sp. DM8]|uniref:Probable chorismate pyruvate-lyase n=1 Tax=Oceanisphaera pacifica TaxID=2818389 RepID=A0ABS3NHT7_9GAMM|nr:chorismate lyase [Oceanisphaera pacifica]